MEFATMAGIGGIFVAVIVSMVLEGSSPTAILLLPALFLVFVGTFGAAMAGGLVRDLPTVARHAEEGPRSASRPTASRPSRPSSPWPSRPAARGCSPSRRWSRTSRTRCCAQGIELAIDGTDPEEIRDILEARDRRQAGRRQGRRQVLRRHGRLRPHDRHHRHRHRPGPRAGEPREPEQLGHLIAGAFVATLWGVLSANVDLAADGQQAQAAQRARGAPRWSWSSRASSPIQAGTNPRLVAQKLRVAAAGRHRARPQATLTRPA